MFEKKCENCKWCYLAEEYESLEEGTHFEYRCMIDDGPIIGGLHRCSLYQKERK